MAHVQLPILVSSILYALAVAAAIPLLTPLWDRATAVYTFDLTPMIRCLGLNPRHVHWGLRAWGLALVLTGVLLWGPARIGLLAIPVVVAMLLAPRYILGWLIARRRRLLRDQMVKACTTLANASRSGQSIPQALATVAKEAPEPIAAEFRRIVHDFHGGRPLPETLVAAKDRLDLDFFTIPILVLLTALDRGGRFTGELDKTAHALRESQRLERKLEADTASGRSMIHFFAVFPAIFAALAYFIHPEGTTLLFTTIRGQIIVLIVCALVYASSLVARWILDIES